MPKRKKRKILIVCENWGLRETISLLLEKEFKILTYSSLGDSARMLNLKPDLIIIDDDIPGFNISSLNKFNSIKSDKTHIVLFIDFIQAEKYKDLYNMESIEIIEKPFSNDILIEKIESLIGNKITGRDKSEELIVLENEIEIDDDSIPAKMEFIKLYIRENYDTISTIRAISEKVNMSPRRLVLYFAKLYNQDIKNYINDVKLEKMIQFIQFSNMDVHEICLRVGFKDKQYACELFKIKYGFNPYEGIKKFRKKIK
ncbi:hypothetical protein DRQ09_08445 [candidate division KSB1 bacterium]|nr:MAG: hypothetical protein DRQ09_08445 [candidate division KSB1 bacterium]